MLAEHLSRADLVGVLAIIHGSVASRGDADFRSLVRRLQDLIGARAGVTAITSTWGAGKDPLVGLRVVNVDYPAEYLGVLGQRGLFARDPVVREHFLGFKLQHWADTFAREPGRLNGAVGEILSLADDFGMVGTREGLGYASGVRDPREAAASFFCFQGLARSRRTEEILALVVPHLHVALRGVARASPDSTPLTERETEILRWVAQGKTTWAISEILSISERTVKFHVGNAVRKLDATTRTHAVAVALERKLIQVD
jgi:LuxR family transcriptional regulator, quorum-sensing system regulator CviR